MSTLGDIYSFGMLVLETLTGKRPTNSIFRQGLSLREYVDLALQNRTMDAVDTRLSLDLQNELHTMGDSPYKRMMDCIVSLLRLGISCTQELPSSRLPTKSIIKELLVMKDTLQRESIEHEDGLYANERTVLLGMIIFRRSAVFLFKCLKLIPATTSSTGSQGRARD